MHASQARTLCVLPLLGLALCLAGCSSEQDPGLGTPLTPTASPHEIPGFPGAEHFVTGITNPYLNFAVGRTFTYESETDEGTEVNTVTVTSDTRTILGVVTTVVYDEVRVNGQVREETYDWYAQDDEGNVWYFGEDTKEFDENGNLVTTAGSWEAGVNGDPGIIMLAEPEVGLRYKQEDSPGNAEDMAKVVSLCEPVEIEYDDFECALQTAEWSLIESGPRDFKFYVAGVGMVYEILNRGANQEIVELVDIMD